MTLLVPLLLIVLVLAAAVHVTRLRTPAARPLIDQHGYRVAAWRY